MKKASLKTEPNNLTKTLRALQWKLFKKLLGELLGNRILQGFKESYNSYTYRWLVGKSDLETSFVLLLQMLNSQVRNS